MAIIATLKTKYGVDCTYHNISDYKETVNGIELILNSYINKTMRQNNSEPLLKTRLNLRKFESIEELDIEGMNHIKYCYNKLTEMIERPIMGVEETVSMPYLSMFGLNFEGEILYDL